MSRFQPALLGGLFIGIMSALPGVNIGNCCCCLWVISGGMLSTYLLQARQDTPVETSEVMVQGLIAGAVGGVLSGIISVALQPLIGPWQQQIAAQMMERLQTALPPENRTQFEEAMRQQSSASTRVEILRSLMFVPISAAFATAGAALGLAFFEKKDAEGAGLDEGHKAAMSTPEIQNLLKEVRVIAPSDEFRRRARVNDESIYARADADPEAFWAAFASELEWSRPWTTVLEWKAPHAKWFVGGQLNVSVNCLDRHVRTARRNKAALIWEGEPGDRRTLTYFDLHREVCQFSNVLKSLGVTKGDRVALYMPLVPELAIAMLACARIGAVHSVVFGGFSSESLRDRINDAQCTVLVTADGGYRRGNIVPLKQMADEALRETPSIRHVVVLKRSKGEAFPVHMQEGRDHWFHELMQDASPDCPPEPMDSEDMLYILYTSGTTGKPKGIVHTTGGYLVGTYATTQLVFDLRDEDVYWCTADIGWVTGHSYVVYGPLANGATVLMYEGAPDWPQKDRFWSLIEKYGVTIFYTAPTAIRAFMKWGTDWPAKRDLRSLRLLGSVGEPINPEAWMWYYEHIGAKRCPVVDTWWQTETGHILITALPGVTPLKPGSATRPFPGITAEIRNAKGERLEKGGGLLALTKPWPGILRGIYGDPERFVEQYWKRWQDGVYLTGDGAHIDEDGYYWLLGRVDDVLNVAGHRIGTMEVESALVDHPRVAEAAVVGRPHEIKGQAVAAFVTLKEGSTASPELIEELKEHVVRKIGALARPDQILFAADLPKTRSGKIMRRLLRDIAEGKALGDTTTLADPNVVARLKDEYESKES